MQSFRLYNCLFLLPSEEAASTLHEYLINSFTTLNLLEKDFMISALLGVQFNASRLTMCYHKKVLYFGSFYQSSQTIEGVVDLTEIRPEFITERFKALHTELRCYFNHQSFPTESKTIVQAWLRYFKQLGV